jgi:hypothetical protein
MAGAHSNQGYLQRNNLVYGFPGLQSGFQGSVQNLKEIHDCKLPVDTVQPAVVSVLTVCQLPGKQCPVYQGSLNFTVHFTVETGV